MKHSVKPLIFGLLITTMGVATAQTENWYIGVSAGQSDFNDWTTEDGITGLRDDFGATLGIVRYEGTQNMNVDDSDFGLKLFGGYSFNEYMAVELSYIDMGTVEAHSRVSGTFFDPIDNTLDGDLEAKAKADIDAFSLDLNLSYPFAESVAVIGRIGFYDADTKLNMNATSTISTDTFVYAKTESSSGLHYGLGLSFALTDAFALRAEWERLDSVEAHGEEIDVDLLSASFVYNF